MPTGARAHASLLHHPDYNTYPEARYGDLQRTEQLLRTWHLELSHDEISSTVTRATSKNEASTSVRPAWDHQNPEIWIYRPLSPAWQCVRWRYSLHISRNSKITFDIRTHTLSKIPFHFSRPSSIYSKSVCVPQRCHNVIHPILITVESS